jgi:hypothetical protein
MTKRLAFGLGVVGLLAAGLALSGRAALAQTTRPLCTGPDSDTYSVGSVAKFGADRYRCLYVFGEKLAPSGVAWVKLQANSNIAPKEPADGR